MRSPSSELEFLQSSGNFFAGEGAEGFAAGVPGLGDTEETGHHGILVRRVHHRDQVIPALCPVKALDLESALFVLRLRLACAIYRTGDVLRALIREFVEDNIRGHDPAPFPASGHG